MVAGITEPGAVVGEMSVLLDRPHTATVRAASDSIVYEFSDAASFLREQPAVALLIARLLAQRLNVATTYLADIMHQYAGHGDHLAMVGEILQSMINLPPIEGLARLGSAIRSKDVSHAGGSATGAAGRCKGASRSMHCASPAASQNAVSAVDIEHDIAPAAGRAAGRH